MLTKLADKACKGCVKVNNCSGRNKLDDIVDASAWWPIHLQEAVDYWFDAECPFKKGEEKDG